jgi:hypothetical protein
VPAAPWVAGYATALLLWLIVLAASKQPTLWKGRALVYLNGAFIAVLLVVILVRQQRPGVGLYVLGGLLLASAGAARNAWILLHIDRGKLDQLLEKCFRQTRASHKTTPTGYTVIAAGSEMSVAITPLLAGHGVRFGGASNSKKAQLIRALIAKQFQPSFPPLRIRA